MAFSIKITIYIILMFSLVEAVLSQSNQKIQILDKETNDPVSFATILNKHKNSGAYADKNGYFIFEFQKNDTLVISCIGYFSKIIAIKTSNDQDVIYLNPKMYNINEIVVKPDSKEQKTRHLGYDKHKPDFTICNTPGAIIASYILNQTQLSIVIKEIIIPTKEKKRSSEHNNIQEGYIRVHLFTVNPVNNSPDKELLTKNLIYNTSELKRNIKIDISDQNILVPKEGVFVGIEWLGENIGNTERHGWRPFLIFTYDIDESLTWTKDALTNNKWELMDENNYWNSQGKRTNNAIFGLKVKTVE